MPLIQSKQISKLLQASIFMVAMPFAAGATANIAASLTTALSSAGDNGVAVPLQASTATAPGVIVTGNNIVQVWDSATQKKLSDSTGNEVYGRLTNAGAAYNLALFTNVAGVETSYSLASAGTLDIEVAYLFTFETYPRDAAVGGSTKTVQNDPSAGGSLKSEALGVTGVDTLSAASLAPNTSKEIILDVNGQSVSSLVAPAPFSVSGTTITWNPANAGYSLAVTDFVIIRYSV